MSWQELSAHERRTLDAVRRDAPETLPLARVLALASRIEPLLLRNARVRFASPADTELESLLWFSPLMRVRARDGLRLHEGIARSLAEELLAQDPPRFAAAWQFVLDHTAHWSAVERILQELRHCALIGDAARERALRRELLRRVRRAGDDDSRVGLARRSRESLAYLAPGQPLDDEAKWLGQYAAAALGGSSRLTDTEPATSLPPELADCLPASYKPASLGIEVRHDPVHARLVLHFVDADGGTSKIDLPTSLPAELHIAADGQPAARHTVSLGTRIALDGMPRSVRITTIDGQHQVLSIELPAATPSIPQQPSAHTWLSHVPEDRALAERVAKWLSDSGIRATLREEGELRGASTEAQDPTIPLLRLWTRQASAIWAGSPETEFGGGRPSLILRAADAEAPAPGQGTGEMITLPDLDAAQPQASSSVAEQLRAWLLRGDVTPTRLPDQEAEISALLAELDDPATEPPRRLAIGDRLAELGDPRPGVGVREVEIAAEGQPEFFRTSATVNLRDGPGTEHARAPAGPLRRGTLVAAAAREGDWRKVTVLAEERVPTDVSGWVHSRFLHRLDPAGGFDTSLMILSRQSTIECDHGGKLVLPEGDAPLSANDVLQASIAACPNEGPTVRPCQEIASITGGKAQLLADDGSPCLLDSLSGLTDGFPPGSVRFRVTRPHYAPEPEASAEREWTEARETTNEHAPRGVSADPAASPVLEIAARTIDRKLVPEPGLFRCLAGDGLEQTRIEAGELSPGAPILLLLPGLAANAEGSFSDLWTEDRNGRFIDEMASRFDGNIVAFNCWSLSRHPVANALELARALPAGARLSMIGHSTGGLLAELLCRSHVAGGSQPFTDEEADLFSATPATRQALAALSKELTTKQLVVERFIAVGTPFRGTLLFQKIEPLLKLLPSLVKIASLGSSILASGAVETLLKALRNPSDLVGIEAIQPGSAFMRLINYPSVTVDADLSAITGDAEASGVLAKLRLLVVDKVFGGDNDLMVPTASMVGGAQRASGGRVAFFQGPHINHFSYFRDPGVIEAIAQAMQSPQATGRWAPLARSSSGR